MALFWTCGYEAAAFVRTRAQGRNVGIAPPAVAHICSSDASTDFSVALMIFRSFVL
jgi:hypothetical protein